MNLYFFFIFVIPAKAGIHILHGAIEKMDSRLRGNDGAYWFSDVVVENMPRAIRIQEEDFCLQDEVDALRATSQRMGGIVTFLGCARDFSEGRDV